MQLDPSILREWDIRGVYPGQINEAVAKSIGYAFSILLKEKQVTYCLVGRDNRLGGETLAQNLMLGLVDSGINVIYLDMVTTPMFNFATHHLKQPYGIMITASHNPKNENGFKIFGDDFLHLNKDDLNKVYANIKADQKIITETKGWIKKVRINDSYVNDLAGRFTFGGRELKVVVDCGNGTVATIVKDAFAQLELKADFLFAESDPEFPNHHPDPNTESNLQALKEQVIATQADLGIAYDGDGDRVGVVDEQGNVIESDHLMAIFIRDLIAKVDNKNFIIDVKCSQALEEDISKVGGTPIMVKNGSAYIESFIHNYPALFGGEYSGHIFFRDRHYGYDDGLYASLRLIELLSSSPVKTSELNTGFTKYFNTPELRVKVADEKKFTVVDQVKAYCEEKGYAFLDIDGVRVKYPDGFALIRASNTGPNLTLRFEATTRERLAEILKEFTLLVNKLVQ